MIVKLKDVVNRVNNNIDRFTTDIQYYLGKGHGECGELAISEHGDLKKDVGTLGFKFHFGFKPGDTLFFSRSFALRKAGMATYEGICSDSTYILRSKDEAKLLSKYLPIVLQSDVFWEYCDTHHTGGVNFLINWSTLADYEFDLPCLEEQQRISDRIWSAYNLKESYKKLLIATDELVKSQFIEMFKDLPINGKIEDLVERNIASVKKSYQSGDEIEYIDISSIDNTSNTVVETTKYEVASAPSRAQQCVKNGDILVSTVRPINRNIAVVTSNLPDLVASTGFCILRPKDGYREYLLSVVKSDAYTERMCDKASGGLYPAVNNSDVLSYGIHIPNKELAQMVSSIYQQADKSKLIRYS